MWSELNPATISMLENGKRNIPKVSTITKLAKGLREPVNRIIELAGYVPKSSADPALDASASTATDRQMRVASHIDDNLTDEQLEEVNNFIEYLKSKHEGRF
jgi:transcriptional regulator with XRE-family HTH domain